MGPLVQLPLLAAQNAVPAKDMAVTSSTIQFFQSIGGLLSTAACQTVLNVSGDQCWKEYKRRRLFNCNVNSISSTCATS